MNYSVKAYVECKDMINDIFPLDIVNIIQEYDHMFKPNVIDTLCNVFKQHRDGLVYIEDSSENRSCINVKNVYNIRFMGFKNSKELRQSMTDDISPDEIEIIEELEFLLDKNEHDKYIRLVRNTLYGLCDETFSINRFLVITIP